MPKPAAAFSALAMTKSMLWWSTMDAKTASHELAPWFPDDVADEQDAHSYSLLLSAQLSAQTRFPLNAESDSGALRDRDWNRSSAAFGHLRERDVELAVGDVRVSVGGVTCRPEAHRPCKAPEVALDEVKRRFGTRPRAAFSPTINKVSPFATTLTAAGSTPGTSTTISTASSCSYTSSAGGALAGEGSAPKVLPRSRNKRRMSSPKSATSEGPMPVNRCRIPDHRTALPLPGNEEAQDFG